MAHPLAGCLAALEAAAPEHGLRVVCRHEDLGWTPEQRETGRLAFLGELPKHRGLTVVVRRFFAPDEADRWNSETPVRTVRAADQSRRGRQNG